MSEEAIRVLAGHVSKQMLQRYGHIRIYSKEAAIFGYRGVPKSTIRHVSTLARWHKIGQNRRQVDFSESKKALNFLVRPLSSDG